MNDKKSNNYKISWGSWKDAWEILVHVVLALCVVYAIYSFFHQGGMENDNVEKVNAEELGKEGQASGGYRTKLDNLNPKLLSDAPAGAS